MRSVLHSSRYAYTSYCGKEKALSLNRGQSHGAASACKHINLLLKAASVAVGQGGVPDLPYNTRNHWEDQNYHMNT